MAFDGQAFDGQPGDTILEQLKTARALISDPAHWVQGSYSSGRGEFCTVGALNKAGGLAPARLGETPSAVAWIYRNQLQPTTGLLVRTKWLTIERWNDVRGRRHSQVLSYFDRLIKEREKQLAKCREVISV